MNFVQKKNILLIILVSCFLLLFASSCYATDNIEEVNKIIEQQEQPETDNSNLSIAMVKLVLVLGVIILAAWFIIKLFGRRFDTKMQGTWLKVVDEVMLGQNRGVVLCKINGKFFALGVTDNQINLLFELEDSDLLNEIAEKEKLEAGENNLDEWTVKIKNLLKTNKKVVQNKNFHLIMQEQTSKIREMGREDAASEKTGTRSDEND